MHAAVWLPRFQLQAVLRAQSVPPGGVVALLDEAPAGAKDKGRVLHASELGEQRGIWPGMSAPQAQARCVQITFFYRDLLQEAAAHQDLLASASLWTPDYEATLPGMCVLDLRRVRELKAQACGQALHANLKQRQLDARVGFALNADLAMLAAQAADPVLVLPDDKAAAHFLHHLTPAVLRPSPEVLSVLSLWGIRTLGDLVRLPRAEVVARLGEEGRLLWDMASGGHERLLKLVRPVTSFRQEQELEHPVECLEPLLFLLRRMLESLCVHLANVWMVATSAWLTLRFEDQSEHQRELKVAEPTRDAELLLRLLSTYLDGLSAKAPVVFLALELTPVRAAGSQTDLFQRTLSDPNRFAETLTQLQAILGQGRVGKAVLLPSRRTDAFEVADFCAPVANRRALAHTPVGLPLRRLRPAPRVQMEICDGRPAAFQQGREHHVICEAEGPWFLSGEWWDRTTSWSKEVWAVQTREGVLYQVARQKEQWVLEGVLG